MTIRTRRKIFILFVFCFAILGIGIVYYSQGYRIDITSFAITKTGALYVESSPQDAHILLNGKEYKNKTNILRNGTFIGGILPKKYRVQLEKDGYSSYEKNVYIVPSSALSLAHIILVPTILPPQATSTLETDDTIVGITDSYVVTQSADKKSYFAIPTQTHASTINLKTRIAALLKQSIISIAINPQEKDSCIIQTKLGLYKYNIIANTLTTLLKATTSAFVVKDNNLFALSPTSSASSTIQQATLTTVDLTLNTIANTTSLIVDPLETLSLDVWANSALTLSNGGSLIFHALSSGTSIQLAYKAKQAFLSPDKKKIIYQDTDGKIAIYFLEDDIQTLDVHKGDTLTLQVPNTANTQIIGWFADSYHFIAQYQNEAYLIEISPYPPINRALLAKDAKQLLYSIKQNIFYTEDGSVLKQYNLSSL